MRTFGLRRVAMGLGLAAALGALPAGQSFAGVQDSVFFISADGSSVAFDVHDVPRREVLSRLLRSEGVEFEWVDSALADERITGAFKGSVEAVLQRLLAQTDFVVIYTSEGERRRIARLIIVGKGGAPSQSIELTKPAGPAMITGIAGPGEASKLTPGGPIALVPPSPAEGALQPLVPAPAATAAPALVPPSIANHPLFIPPPATTR